MTGTLQPGSTETEPDAKAAVSLRPGTAASSVDVVTIASSTGGPAALASVLAALPLDLKVPVMIVQHMPVGFTAAFAERLSQRTGLQVVEAGPDQSLDAAQVWVAAADHHMFLTRGSHGIRLQLNQADLEHSCRPLANVLFRSAADVFADGVLAVVLTGMGVDGLASSQAIVDAGWCVIVQDETCSIVWGMAGSVAQAGLADEMLSPTRIGRAINQRIAQTG